MANKRDVMTMDSGICIGREIAELKQPESEMVTLAEAAAKMLGYTVMVEQVCKPLLTALTKLEIPILDADDVIAHQKRKGKIAYEESEEDIDVEWHTTKISKYREPIPEFVLSKAVEIKKEIPAVDFAIQHMEVVPDPFLIAFLGSESYYVEVWEEPKFEGRLTKADKS